VAWEIGKKNPAKAGKQQCAGKALLKQADDALDEIDKALAENEWHGDPPRRLVRRPRRKPVGTTQPPPSDLSS